MTSTEIANASKIMLGTTEAVKMYIGSTQVWEAQTTPVGPLPAGYTELEYISSTSSGGQYIDLNIKLYKTANTEYDIAIKFNIKGSGSDNTTQPTIFGCQRDSSPYPGTFIRKDANSNRIQCRYIGSSSKDSYPGNTNQIIEFSEQTSPNKNVYTSVGNSTHNWGTSLFCYFSNSSNSPARFVEADLYYFKLFVNGTLVRDLIPCKNSNNVVGMYDVVNDVFYTSPNGNAFVAGPVV